MKNPLFSFLAAVREKISSTNSPYSSTIIVQRLKWRNKPKDQNLAQAPSSYSIQFQIIVSSRFCYILLCYVGESWGMANTFLLGLINATYMHDLKSLVYNHKVQVKYY